MYGKQVSSHVPYKSGWCKVNIYIYIYAYISGIAGVTGWWMVVETSDILLFVIVKIFLGLKTSLVTSCHFFPLIFFFYHYYQQKHDIKEIIRKQAKQQTQNKQQHNTKNPIKTDQNANSNLASLI